MNSFRLLTTALLIALFSSGCVNVELGDASQMTSEEAAKLEQQVPIYTETQLAANNDYIRAGSVDTVVCRHGLVATTTQDRVVDLLRQKALAAGANGLTDVSCEPGPVDEFSGCAVSTACQATLIKTVTPDTANN